MEHPIRRPLLWRTDRRWYVLILFVLFIFYVYFCFHSILSRVVLTLFDVVAGAYGSIHRCVGSRHHYHHYPPLPLSSTR